MSEAKRYGSTEIEEHAKQSEQAHKIVNEIMKFGVNEKQLLMIIKRLALNLENNNHMKKIARLADDCIRDRVVTDSTPNSPILNE